MDTLLVVALCARPLAQSAKRGGHAVSVLDLYGDCDTRSSAARSRKVADSRGGFDPAALLQAAHEFCPPPAGLVAGSGFEDNPALLARLAEGRKLYGNSPETIKRVKDPRLFYPLLDKLTLPYPEVSLAAPKDSTGWLLKRIGGHGGSHVAPADSATDADRSHYFQRLAPGKSCSVLFLANGERARVIGFNEQFTAEINGSPYWYAGAINRAEMLQRVRRDIVQSLDPLVGACGLTGLNSLDFVTTGESYQVLEVNPRPSATMDLYDQDFPTGLFDWHLRACAGELPESAPVGKVRAHAVVYAPQSVLVKPRFHFPDWCSDIPEPGSEFPRGAPVCMVHAEGDSPPEVRQLIEQRRAAIARRVLETAA